MMDQQAPGGKPTPFDTRRKGDTYT